MMKPLYSLPDTLVPLPDESMAGLVVRYAALYGFPSPERLFDRLRLKRAALPTLMRMDPLSEEGGAVAALLNLEPDRARAMSNWHPHAFEITVGGHVLNTDLVDVYTRQCCPLCLRDSAHHRASWFIAAFPVCPEHGLELDCACPRCGKRLSWSGLGPHVCGDPGCGFDLRDSKPRPVSGPALEAAVGLQAIYGGRPHASGLDLDGAIQACLSLGRLALGISLVKRHRVASFVNKHRSELPRVIGAGWLLLDPWPEAFHAALGSKLAANGTADMVFSGMMAAFGDLYKLVQKRQGWRATLCDELRRYALKHNDVAVKRGKHVAAAARDTGADAKFDLAAVGDALGVSHYAAVRIAGQLQARRSTAKRSAKFLVDAEAVQRLVQAQSARGELISAKDAAAMLGVSSTTVRDFVTHGLLSEIPAESRALLYRSIVRGDVEAILTAFDLCAEGLPRLDNPTPGFRRSGRGGSRDGFGSRAMVNGVLAGTLKPAAVWTGGQGIARYLFSPSPERKRRGSNAINGATAAPRKDCQELLSMKEAAGILAMSRTTLRHLVTDGFITEAAVGPTTSHHHRIPHADIQAVLAAFEHAADGVPHVDAPGPGHCKSGRGGSKDGFRSRAMVGGVLAGTLKPVAVWSGGRGIGRYLFAHPGKGE